MSKERIRSWHIEDDRVIDLLVENGFTCGYYRHGLTKADLIKWYVTSCPIEYNNQYVLPDGNTIKSYGTGLILVEKIPEEGRTFLVKTLEELDAIIRQYKARGSVFKIDSEHPTHICHIESPVGDLYFNAPDEETRNSIWCQWHSEAKEAKRNWEESMNNQERASGKHEVEKIMSHSLQSIKEYRRMPFLKRGLRVHMMGKWGRVTSGSDGYVMVVFDKGMKSPRRIHPTWDCTYFDKDGKVLANYKEGKEPPAFVPFEQEAEPHD